MLDGFIKNPDTEFLYNLRKRIKANSGFCPCKREKTKDTKCPCKDFRENGDCACGMYIHDPSCDEEYINEGYV